MEYLKKVWQGQEKLWITFWLITILGGVIYAILMGAIVTFIDGAAEILKYAIIIFGLVFCVFWVVSVWRSANRYKGAKIWKILAKVFVVFSLLNQALGFTNIIRGIVS